MKKRHGWGHIGFGVGLIILAMIAVGYWALTGTNVIGPRNTNVIQSSWPLFGAAVFVIFGVIKILIGLVFLIWGKDHRRDAARWSAQVGEETPHRDFRR